MSRRWEHELLARLKAAGHLVSIRHSEMREPTARAVDGVLAVERLRSGSSLASRDLPLPLGEAGPEEITVDLTTASIGRSSPVLTIEFLGTRSLSQGMAEMFATGDQPELTTRLNGVPVGLARPMIGDRVWLSRAGNDLLAGAISLIEQSVARFFSGQLEPLAETPHAPSIPRPFVIDYLRSFSIGIVQRAFQKLRPGRRPFYWQVGYRAIEPSGVAGVDAVNATIFRVLPDDGRRFYADPFVITKNDRSHLFVEEFSYSSGKGVISVAELGVDGRFGVPRIALEEPHHLSYPQVFERDGETFMIPEGSGAREVVLYRASHFPDQWVRDTVLIADREIGDATLLEYDRKFWLFGTERRGFGSASDTMAVFVAPDLRGPFAPHPNNPILIDRSAARPGGAFKQTGNRLFLPVQDGTGGYGNGLRLAELLSLDMEEVRFAPPLPLSELGYVSGEGIHTHNSDGFAEVVDWTQ